MPIYEFACADCGHQFERLIRSGDVAPDRCPSCASEGLERLFSLPGVQTDHTRQNALASAHRRKAKIGRERVEEQRKYEQNHEGH